MHSSCILFVNCKGYFFISLSVCLDCPPALSASASSSPGGSPLRRKAAATAAAAAASSAATVISAATFYPAEHNPQPYAASVASVAPSLAASASLRGPRGAALTSRPSLLLPTKTLLIGEEQDNMQVKK